jgi:hypothetical protein
MRIVRFVLYAVLLLGLAATAAKAQERSIPLGVRMPINEIKFAQGGTRCGKYFFLYPSTRQFGKASITFNLVTPPTGNQPGNIDILDRIDLEKFRITEDPTAQTPTFMILKDHSAYPPYEIRISPEDLRRSPCLRPGLSA